MRLNRAIKRAAIAVGRFTPRSDASKRKVVFCYHSVRPTRPHLSSTPDVFERHIEWLNQHCQLVSLRALAAGTGIARSGKPIAALTFDDGYRDNHSYAFPILEKYRTPATFFITAGYLERDPQVLHRFERMVGGESAGFAPLAWSQVRELLAAGMEIGSHTYSHPNLARISREEAEQELRTSRDLIGDRLGTAVDLFAYPFGKPRVHFTAETREVARLTGYRIAAAVTYRGVLESDSLLQIPRFFTDGDSIAKLEAKVQGAYDLIGWWQEHVPESVMRAVSPQDYKR
jgi:peptidoglycan/xylan/chitin deacetylase (PgdA/CDA1 family)